MATHIATLGTTPSSWLTAGSTVDVTSRCGGSRGRMIQLTQGRQGEGADMFHAIHLTHEQALQLAHSLIDWAAGETNEEG